MPTITRSALVPYAPAQMFRLVNDVEKYPEFLNWCVDAVVLERAPESLVAELTVRLAGVEQRFATRNALDEPRRISMRLVRGPFRELGGEWSFRGLGEGTKVALSLQFEFANPLLDGAFGNGFAGVAGHLVADFCDRAEVLYGRRR